MNNILIVTGSARPGCVNKAIVSEVVKLLDAKCDIDVTIADLASLNMPYLNTPTIPSDKDHVIADDSVRRWSAMVEASDGVVFVAPEYNHNLSGIQKTAIDWLYNEWRDKPTAFVGYGAYAGKHSYEAFVIVSQVVKMKLCDTMAGIKLGEVVGYDGEIIDRAQLDDILSVTLDELVLAAR